MEGYTPAFVRLLLQPRTTMRWILEDDPNYGVMIISLLAGVTAMLHSSLLHGLHPLPGLHGFHPTLDSILALGVGATPEWPLLIAAIGICGGLFGVLAIYVGAFLLWFLARLSGGRGKYQEVRSALAWSFVMYSWLLPLWIMLAILQGPELRMQSFSFDNFFPPPGSSTRLLWVMYVSDHLLRLMGLVWTAIKLSVAMRYPLWKAALNTLIAALILAVLIAKFHPFGF